MTPFFWLNLKFMWINSVYCLKGTKSFSCISQVMSYVFISSWLLSLRFVNTHSTHNSTADKNLIWFGEVYWRISYYNKICMNLGIHLVYQFFTLHCHFRMNWMKEILVLYSIAKQSFNCFSLLKQYKITSCEVNWSNATQCTFALVILQYWNVKQICSNTITGSDRFICITHYSMSNLQPHYGWHCIMDITFRG